MGVFLSAKGSANVIGSGKPVADFLLVAVRSLWPVSCIGSGPRAGQEGKVSYIAPQGMGKMHRVRGILELWSEDGGTGV